MAIEGTPQVPFGEPDGIADVAVQRPWRMRAVLSRTGEIAERFLTASSFDRGPWITVAFAAGIGAWFLLDNQWQWSAAIGAAMLLALAAIAVWRGRDDRAALRLAVTVISSAFAIGMAVVWSKSELVGAPAIERPAVVNLDARILEREEQPAEGRVRLTLAARDAEAGQPIKVRVNVPTEKDFPLLEEGARVRMKARLMPPSAPILPGAYDFARAAWFKGLAATGSLIGEIEVVEKAGSRNSMSHGPSGFFRHMCDPGSTEHRGRLPQLLPAATAAGFRLRMKMPCAMRD